MNCMLDPSLLVCGVFGSGHDHATECKCEFNFGEGVDAYTKKLHRLGKCWLKPEMSEAGAVAADLEPDCTLATSKYQRHLYAATIS